MVTVALEPFAVDLQKFSAKCDILKQRKSSGVGYSTMPVKRSGHEVNCYGIA